MLARSLPCNVAHSLSFEEKSGFKPRELPKKADACTTYQSFSNSHHPSYRIFTEILVTPINKRIMLFLFFILQAFSLKDFKEVPPVGMCSILQVCLDIE